jgi:N-acetylglutamate synthase-like GNAT family acetyltransferase
MSAMRFATEQDVDKLIRFLGQAEVNGEKIESIYPQFMLLEDKNGIIQATIGYERAGKSGMLRSLVLSPAVDKVRFLQFFQVFLAYIQEQGVEDLYLITDKKDSLPLFHTFGFKTVEKESVPNEIQELEHFISSVKRQEAYILSSSTG